MKSIDFMLEEMTSFHTVSGMERKFANWFKDEIVPFAEATDIDKRGNLVARKGKSPSVGLFSHLDSVGFMVKDVAEETIELVKIGKPKNASWARMVVLSKTGEIPGILICKEEKEKESYFLDLGSEEHAHKVSVGDYVAFANNFTRTGDLIASKGLDNKIGCYLAFEVFKQCRSAFLVGTVGEEQKPAGASYVARSLSTSLQLALILDVTYDENIMNKYPIKIGRGPAICLKDDLLPAREPAEKLIATAEKRGIPFQIEVLQSGGSDAKAISDAGIPFVFVGVPIRYMHSPSEIANMKDIENAVNLISAFLSENT